MIKEAIGIGETLEIAKEAACRELGIESHEAEFEILQTPVKGTLGIFGKKEAKVRAFITISPLTKALNYLQSITECMGLRNLEVKCTEEENAAEIHIFGEQSGKLIGKRGETLNSLQYLLSLVANNSSEDAYFRISLDIENYREKREKNLKTLAHKTAKDALKTRRKRFLEPMNPYERKIIHMEVEGINGVTSWSEGENQARHVVIGLDNTRNRYKEQALEERSASLYEKLN